MMRVHINKVAFKKLLWATVTNVKQECVNSRQTKVAGKKIAGIFTQQ